MDQQLLPAPPPPPPPPAPRKRKRIARSCEQCRVRKVRCDQEYPCGPCRRSRDQLTCGYRDTQNLKTTTTAAAQLLLRQDGEAAAGTAAAHSSTTANDRDAIRRLEQRVRVLEDEVFAAGDGDSRVNYDVDDDDDDDGGGGGGRLGVVRAKPRLRFTRDKVRLFGSSHWVHTAEKVFRFASFDAQVEPSFGPDKEEFVRACKELAVLRNSLKATQQPADLVVALLSASNLRASLPPRDLCDQLLDGYTRTFERLYRILNTASFLDQYSHLWDEPPSQEPVSKPFLIQLSLVLAIGVPFLPTSLSDPVGHFELQRQAQQWIAAAQYWLTTHKSAQSMHGLQISCLVLIARQVNGLGTSPTFSPATVLSMAMQMGLHRNHPHLSSPQTESLARLWATVVELYLIHCLETGCPVLLPPLQELDAPVPTSTNENSIGHGPTSLVAGTEQDEYMKASIQRLLLKSQPLRIQALQLINNNGGNNNNSDTIPYETVLKLAAQLRAASTHASSFFTNASTASLLGAQASFPAKFIDALFRRHILLLYRPFYIVPDRANAFPQARKACLESCMIMAAYTDDCSSSDEDDDFARLMVYGAGHLRAGLSLDVIVTLGYEVMLQLDDEDDDDHEGQSTTVDIIKVETKEKHGKGSRSSYDPARELARAARQPILRRLEHIRVQLARAIQTLGSASLKRYLMVSALLAQIAAREERRGEQRDARAAFYAAVREALVQCREWMEANVEKMRRSDGKKKLLENGAGLDGLMEEEGQEMLDFGGDGFGEFDFGDLMDDPMALFNAYTFGGHGMD